MKFFTSRDKGVDKYGALSSTASIDLEEVEISEIKDMTVATVKEDDRDEVASMASGVSSLGEGYDSDVFFGDHDSDDDDDDESSGEESDEDSDDDDKSLVVQEQSSLVRRSFDHGNHEFETKNHSQAILVAGSSQTAKARPGLSRQNSMASGRSRPGLSRQNSMQSVRSRPGLSRQSSMTSVRTSSSRASAGRGLMRQSSMQPLRTGGLERQNSMRSTRSSARRRIVPLERSDGPSSVKDGSRHGGVALDGESSHSQRHKNAEFHPRPRRALSGVRRTATDSSELQSMRAGLSVGPTMNQHSPNPKEVEGEHPRKLLARAQSMDDAEALALRNAAKSIGANSSHRVRSSHNPRRRNSIGAGHHPRQKTTDSTTESKSHSKSKKKIKESDGSVSTHVTSKTTKSKKPKSKKSKDGEASVSTTKTKSRKKTSSIKKHEDGEEGKSKKSSSKHRSSSVTKKLNPSTSKNSGMFLVDGTEDHVHLVHHDSTKESFLQLDLA